MSETANFYIRQDDLRPPIRAILKDATDTPLNLTSQTVRFVMVDADTETVKVDAAASVVDAANGVVEYQWTGDDTDTAGLFLARWVVTNGASQPLTVPNLGDLIVQVY